MKIPDVIGLETDEAVAEITNKGFLVQNIIVTKPEKVTQLFGCTRVVRISALDDKKVDIVVAYQDYLKGGV